ncbi:unnamed protein product [Chilo suppressalis]|uniref:Major facilitator superfamily (MFS) profile domain-containing protein n=1 Tax=Chilo suppressalis TaxID=168631 RepID=A0ABN8EEU8_CHISP|nr:unnamed protein product [Chilo suppressalis]
MENRGHVEEIPPERQVRRVEDLRLDSVVASQPEVGPTPPDGGYGWLIVVSAAVYHVTVPSLLSLYGFVILKTIKEEDHEEGEKLKIWDADIALVPFIMVVLRLLLESWCRAVVKVFNMPRFMALSGLCLTVAGVLMSSYATDIDYNDHIVSIFAGIFAGIGCALTGQQTEVIITHYFREKLTMAQRLVRMAPSVGNTLMPVLIGYMCTKYDASAVVMIYAAIIMQNCVFLAAYTRPVYIEKVIRTTYNMLRDATEDDDEVIFSNQNRPADQPQSSTKADEPIGTHDEDVNDVVVFKSKKDAKEIMDPAIEYREKRSATAANNENRFSSDFSSMFAETSNRFSSNFGSQDVFNYNRVNGYQELENIDAHNPQPLYRETTVDAPNNIAVFPEASPGTIRRTASIKKNLITITNMLLDINFYMYALLHVCTTFSITVLGVFFPALVWEVSQSVMKQSLNIWSISSLVAVAHASALCFIMLCIVMPKSINEKSRLCAAFCIVGALGFYGITISGNKSFLVLWCMCASFSTAASGILQQPLYNSTLNEFDTTATITATNLLAAGFILAWSLARNYEYKTSFLTASILQIATALIFFAMSFRRRR